MEEFAAFSSGLARDSPSCKRLDLGVLIGSLEQELLLWSEGCWEEVEGINDLKFRILN